MSKRGELLAFGFVLATIIGLLHAKTLFLGKILSPADVLFVSNSFRGDRSPLYEPYNRLPTDPVLQFEPWIEHNRTLLRQGRLPLWNDYAGCGTPHLANAQSAVFDPFHLIAYLGMMPEAIAWMVACRLWVAGIGMFLLTRRWKLRHLGRWFAGLIYPFCGFVTVWLLYPVTSVAIWLPWLILATDLTVCRPTLRNGALLSLVIGLTLLGGHIQTSAHCLLLSGLHALWRGKGLKPRFIYAMGVIFGFGIGSIEIIPLGSYLGKSPVWADRATERPSPWRIKKPRLLDVACTAMPYLYGSQRRGQPNLARGLGVHNLNESSGGFAGLVTLVFLAPIALTRFRGSPRIRFLTVIVLVAFCAAFEIPPIPNLIRLIPVLNVTDNRRLTLWVVFGLTILGGIGLDKLGVVKAEKLGIWLSRVGISVAVLFLCASVAIPRFEGNLRNRYLAYYESVAKKTEGADPSVYRDRALRQVEQTVRFVPTYLTLQAAHCLAIVGLAYLWVRGQSIRLVQALAMAIALLDVISFGYQLSPEIERSEDRPIPLIIDYLKREVGSGGRILGLGEELPPNTLMRYGLADIRDYDSVEMERAWNWFEPLYEPGSPERTSRREVRWSGVDRARDRLIDASVRAVVGVSKPPEAMFDRVEKVGDVWVARLNGKPLVEGASLVRMDHGLIELSGINADEVIIRQIFDTGWRADASGRPLAIEPYRSTFMKIKVPDGMQALVVKYDPPEVRVAGILSFFSLFCVGFALTGSVVFEFIRSVVLGLGRNSPLR